MAKIDFEVPSQLTTELELNAYKVMMAIKGFPLDISSNEEKQIYKGIMAAQGDCENCCCGSIIKSVSAESIPYGNEATVKNIGTSCEQELVFGIPEGKPGSNNIYFDFKNGKLFDLNFSEELETVNKYMGFATQSGLLSVSVKAENINVRGQDVIAVYYDDLMIYSTGMRNGENAILLPISEGTQVKVVINKRANPPIGTLFPFM